jgi:hypothetical protein
MRRKQFAGESGQAFVLVAVFLVVLMGFAAAAVDVGAWYRAHRHLQATVDSAAKAGAQALPEDPGFARELADEYMEKNGGVATATVEVGSRVVVDDQISVTATRQAPGFFARVLGFEVIQVRARATARSGKPDAAQWAAPFGVDEQHDKLQCRPLPCFGEPTELDLEKVGPGAFRLINIDGSRGGTGPETLGEWIREGHDGFMPLGWYYSDPGAKFNSSHVRSALDARLDTEMLLPVYRRTIGGGANFEYEVVGWAGYLLTGYEIQGSKKNKLYGSFTRVTWAGIASESDGGPDFGVRVIDLVE